MAEIQWPDFPYLGQIYTSDNGDQWRWNGYAWDSVGGLPPGLSGSSFPVPKVSLLDDATITSWDAVTNAPGSTITLYRAPYAVAMDITNEMIEKGLWLEMVIYRKRARSGKVGINQKRNGGAYLIPTPYVNGVNTLEASIGNPLSTRGGIHYIKTLSSPFIAPFGMDRPNHYQITSVNQTINAYEYLNGRFMLENTGYRDASTGTDISSPCMVDISRRRRGELLGSRFGYSSKYSPMYIAFRYITRDNNSNTFISGPLSRVVKIAASVHPFIQNPAATITYGKAAVDLNPAYNTNEMTAWFETKLP